MNDQAWLEGRKNGRIDRLRGTKNEYAWVVLLNEGYCRSYSLGYRHGWTRPDQGPLYNRPPLAHLSRVRFTYGRYSAAGQRRIEESVQEMSLSVARYAA